MVDRLGVDGRSTERVRDLPDTTVYKTRTDSISIPGAFLVAQVKLHLVKLHLFTLLVKLHLLALLVKLQTQNLKQPIFKHVFDWSLITPWQTAKGMALHPGRQQKVWHPMAQVSQCSTNCYHQ